MFFTEKKIFVVLVFFGYSTAEFVDSVKGDAAIPGAGFEFARIGNFGTISALSSHPSFAHLGLSPRQATGFMNVLLTNGLLNNNLLRQSNGQPILQSSQNYLSRNFCNTPGIDPYFLLLLSNYAKYLPFGLGSQGFYGSTGLPKSRSWDVFKYNSKT